MKIPQTLAELISLVESNNNPHAVRYEQWMRPTRTVIENCKKFNGGAICTDQTAQELCKFSYGLYQIMGIGIYELNYKHSIFDFVNNTDDQLDVFINFISSRRIDYSLFDVLHNQSHRENFAFHYNGDRLTYSKRLIDVYKSVGGVI